MAYCAVSETFEVFTIYGYKDLCHPICWSVITFVDKFPNYSVKVQLSIFIKEKA